MSALVFQPHQNSINHKQYSSKPQFSLPLQPKSRSGVDPHALLAELSKEALFGQAIKYAEGTLRSSSEVSSASEKLALGIVII
jgi:hypothetical protein